LVLVEKDIQKFMIIEREVIRMETNDFKEIPYTIEIDWEGGTVWLNNHISKEKIVITEKDSKSISNAFALLAAKRKGLF
jgi:hypothetical protein